MSVLLHRAWAVVSNPLSFVSITQNTFAEIRFLCGNTRTVNMSSVKEVYLRMCEQCMMCFILSNEMKVESDCVTVSNSEYKRVVYRYDSLCQLFYSNNMDVIWFYALS